MKWWGRKETCWVGIDMNINELVSIGRRQDFDHYGTLGFLLLVLGLLEIDLWHFNKVHMEDKKGAFL